MANQPPSGEDNLYECLCILSNTAASSHQLHPLLASIPAELKALVLQVLDLSICGGDYWSLISSSPLASASVHTPSSNPSSSSNNTLQHLLKATRHHAPSASQPAMGSSGSAILGMSTNPALIPNSGKPCGYIFKKGDGIYRCRQCGLDDTCVMCSDCFHSTKHDGHEILFSITSQGGGCCDCGDAEAWKVDLGCPFHGELRSSALATTLAVSLPSHFDSHCASTFEAILNFIVDCISRAPATHKLPLTPAEYWAGNLHEAPMPGTPDPVFGCILWNDETHSFQEVIQQVSEAIGCSVDFARKVAESVDTNGRHVIAQSASLERLISIGKIIAQIGLHVSIAPLDQIAREDMCGILIDWMCQITSLPPKSIVFDRKSYPPLEHVISKKLCEQLFSFRVSRQLELAHLERFAFFPAFEESPESRQGLIIDYLLQLEARMWKGTRIQFHQFCISTIMATGEYKRKLAFRFAVNYLQLAEYYLFHDRECDLSSLTLSVQLFSVPSIAASLVQTTPILPIIYTIMRTFYLSEVDPAQYPLTSFLTSFKNAQGNEEIPLRRSPLMFEGRLLTNPRIWTILQDSKYLISCAAVKDEHFKANPDFLKQFVQFLQPLQNMQPITRQTQSHIEYESDAWVNGFNLSAQLAQYIASVAECYKGDVVHVKQALRSVVNRLRIMWSKSANGFNKDTTSLILAQEDGSPREVAVPDYQVSVQPVSFHHPLHWMLSRLFSIVCCAVPPSQIAKHIASLTANFASEFEREYHCPLVMSATDIFEGPLQSIVLASQIRSGLWVRNGLSVRSQALHYREHALRDLYDCDMFLLQIGFQWIDPESFFLQILHRFELMSLLTGSLSNGKNDFGDSAFWIVVEDFLHTIIIILTEESRIRSDIAADIKREVAHVLHVASGSGGLSFSKLTKYLAEHLLSYSSGDESFESILSEMATFEPPVGTADHGLYRLKPEHANQTSRFWWHFTRNQRQEYLELKVTQHPVRISSAMKGLRNCTASPSFCRMLYIILSALLLVPGSSRRASTRLPAGSSVASEPVLACAIHLISAALAYDSRKAFFAQSFKPVTDNGFVNSLSGSSPTLLSMILELAERIEDLPEVKEARLVIEDILAQFEGPDSPPVIRAYLMEWRASVATPDLQEALKAADDQADLKRTQARARQAEIMAQFQKAQSAFQIKFGDELIDSEDDEGDEHEDVFEDASDNFMHREAEEFSEEKNHIDWDYPEGNCIVCQEVLNSRSPTYGVLGYVQHSQMLRPAPLGSMDLLKAIIRVGDLGGLDAIPSDIIPYQYDERRTPIDSLRVNYPAAELDGLVVSSCGHLIHSRCLDSYFASVLARHNAQPTRNHPDCVARSEFICPLCKATSNILLPSLKSMMPAKIPESVTYLPLAEESASGRLAAALSTWDEMKVRGVVRRSPSLMLENQSRFLARSSEDIEAICLERVVRVLSNLMLEQLPVNELDPRRAQFEFGPLINVFWYTLSCLEISSRSTSSCVADDAVDILDSLSTQNQTALILLSDIIQFVLRGKFTLPASFCFTRVPCNAFTMDSKMDPLFVNVYPCLAVLSFAVDNGNEMLGHVKLYYMLHVLQTLVALCDTQLSRADVANLWLTRSSSDDVMMSSAGNTFFTDGEEAGGEWVVAFLNWIRTRLRLEAWENTSNNRRYVYSYCRALSLPFLRWCVILLRIRFMMSFPRRRACADDGSQESEYMYLMRILCLDKMGEMVQSDLKESSEFPQESHVLNFLDDALSLRKVHKGLQPVGDGKNELLAVYSPLPYRLAFLPKAMNVLFEEAIRFVCSKCKSIPLDPALCLLCGQWVCSQSYCCSEAGQGECNTHMDICGKEVGIFLMVKKSVMILLCGSPAERKGTFMNPPYLDVHGEVDVGLRRGRPQYLNERRLFELAQMWLQHGIPAFITRKLEATMDYGGWSSL